MEAIWFVIVGGPLVYAVWFRLARHSPKGRKRRERAALPPSLTGGSRLRWY